MLKVEVNYEDSGLRSALEGLADDLTSPGSVLGFQD